MTFSTWQNLEQPLHIILRTYIHTYIHTCICALPATSVQVDPAREQRESLCLSLYRYIYIHIIYIYFIFVTIICTYIKCISSLLVTKNYGLWDFVSLRFVEGLAAPKAFEVETDFLPSGWMPWRAVEGWDVVCMRRHRILWRTFNQRMQRILHSWTTWRLGWDHFTFEMVMDSTRNVARYCIHWSWRDI